MGVHTLLYWTAADGAARREAYDALADAIACLGSSAAATERWSAQAAALRRVAGRGADDLPSARAAGGEAVSLHRVSISDEPDQLFLLSKAARQVVQAGPSMQGFLDNLNMFKARGSMQLDGTRHRLGDFCVCLARAVQAPQQSFLGIAVDVEYLPLDDAATAAPLLQDLADVLGEAVAAAGGRLRQVPSSTAAFQLPATCGPRHRAAQYVQLQQLFGESTAG